MFHFFPFNNYSDELLLVMGITVILGAIIIGFMTDMLLGDRGFGAFGNGLLAVVGCFTGIYVRNAYFGHSNVNELLLTGALAAGTATVLLMTLGVVKHWVSD